MANRFFIFIFCFFTVSLFVSLEADVRLPSIFSDHMVLQKRAEVPVWGWADPGEDVSLTLDQASAKTTTGPDGKWQAKLDLGKEGPGPFQFLVTGKNKLTAVDVVIGEVWLCSGQSNTSMELQYCLGGNEEAEQSSNPLLRMFTADRVGGVAPMDNTPGSWSVASPQTSGHFSAIGYYFGKSVQNKLQVPVGMINSSLWATAVQAWTSSEALDQDPVAKKEKDAAVSTWATLPKRFADFQVAFPAWAAKYARADHPPVRPDSFARPAIATTDWKTVKMPGLLKDGGLPDAGVVWLRHKVTISADQAGKPWTQALGEIHYGTVYWNGVKVDELTPASPLRRVVPWEQPWTFRIPADQVKAGEAILAIRLYSPAGGAGLSFEEKKFPDFVGDWLAKTEYELPPLATEALAAYPGLPPFKTMDEPLVPTYCFNGMISPLIPYAIAGAIWYQGEGNVGEAAHYRTLLPLMIGDWRKRWGYNFPFDIVQLPNNGLKKTDPGEESRWAEMREAQMAVAQSLPNMGLAATLDTADADLHPKNKKDPGERLALIALNKTYGQKETCSGPVFDSMKIEDDKIRIHLLHTDGGLVAKPLPATYATGYSPAPPFVPQTAPLVLPVADAVQGFTLRGADAQWKWAHAKIEGDDVVVWADGVSNPTAVRYAWADNPTCNLYNGAGLPLASFRTDANRPPIAK